MQSWNLLEIEMPGGSRSPVVLGSHDAARAVLLSLQPGQALGDHEVKERAWLTVVEGSVEYSAGEQSLEAGVGTLVMFDPGERHSVTTVTGARLLLMLAPWPAEDHYQPGEQPTAGNRPREA